MLNRELWEKGDRRQLTVLFCDVAGSARILEVIGEEDWSLVLREYHATCRPILEKYEGHIAQYLGDGLLAYFGYPRSREDNPHRAIKAALEIVAQTGAMNARVRAVTGVHTMHPIALRIAIHTGLVVVDQLGRDASAERIALGIVPTIAARLQEHATDNSIVLSESTFRLVAGSFECRKLGSFPLKGISVPQPAYQVVHESVLQSRFDVAMSRGLSPFVGRDDAIQQLTSSWHDARSGRGQVALISGDPGLGKSRLVREFTARLEEPDALLLTCRCSAYYQDSAYFPLIHLLFSLLGLKPADTDQKKLERLEHATERLGMRSAETLPLLARLLSIPLPQPQATGFSAQQEKLRLQELLVTWLIAESKAKPLRLFFEDVHWIDPSSRELLDKLAREIATSRILLIIAFRPEINLGISGAPHMKSLTLAPLTRRAAETMVRNLDTERALSEGLVQQVATQTDGVPLFLEELTAMAIAQRDNPQLSIPASLHDLLMERLDRLGEARETAQLAATIGAEFSYEILCAISPLDEAALRRHLSELMASGLVREHDHAVSTTYSFKHALIRDAAYQSLLARSRRLIHQRVADVLTSRFPDAARNQPELIAHHYAQAGFTQKAVDHWQKAGLRSAERYELQEAVRHLRKSLELLETLPRTSMRLRQELELQSVLAGRLVATQGYGAPGVESVYSRALELAQEVGDTSRRLQMMLGLESFHLMRSNFQTAQRIADECLVLARQLGDPARELICHWVLGEIYFHKGDHVLCESHVAECMNKYQRTFHRPRTLQDPAVMSFSYCSWSRWALGYPDRALSTVKEGVALADSLAHPFSKAVAYSFQAGLHLFRGEVDQTIHWADQAIEVCTSHSFPIWLAVCKINRGLAIVEKTGDDRGVEEMTSGIELWERSGSVVSLPVYYTMLAQALARIGQAETGLQRLETAQSIIDRTGEHYYEPELCRVRGELMLKAYGDRARDDAIALFSRALDIAGHQMTKSWELRAAMSLVRCVNDDASLSAAQSRLSSIYHWFTEGADTADQIAARRLLTEWVQ